MHIAGADQKRSVPAMCIIKQILVMRKAILFIIAIFSIISHLQAQLPAFPGAEGWGRYSREYRELY